jgi:hypothetical protein
LKDVRQFTAALEQESARVLRGMGQATRFRRMKGQLARQRRIHSDVKDVRRALDDLEQKLSSHLQTLGDGSADKEPSIRLVGAVWHIRFQGEKGDYPAKGNKCLPWLAKLLGAPDRQLTVAQVLGDPEVKLAVDAMMGGEREADGAAIAYMKERLADIDDIAKDTDGSEELEEETAELLER